MPGKLNDITIPFPNESFFLLCFEMMSFLKFASFFVNLLQNGNTVPYFKSELYVIGTRFLIGAITNVFLAFTGLTKTWVCYTNLRSGCTIHT